MHGTGARALRHEVDQVLRQVEHRLPDMASGGVDALLIGRDAVLGLSPMIERMGGRKDLSKLLEIRRRAGDGRKKDAKEDDSDDLSIL